MIHKLKLSKIKHIYKCEFLYTNQQEIKEIKPWNNCDSIWYYFRC